MEQVGGAASFRWPVTDSRLRMPSVRWEQGNRGTTYAWGLWVKKLGWGRTCPGSF